MKRIGILVLVVAALATTLVLSTPNTASALVCRCGGLLQTAVNSAKSQISCTDAQNKLYAKVSALACADRCYENLVITTACFYDTTDLRYHISGYLQYQCAINCDPNP